jgi:hypothetical protein
MPANALTTCIYGDVDGNGTVNLNDSVALIQYLRGQRSIFFERADVNQNTVVDFVDVNLLTNYLVDNITDLNPNDSDDYYSVASFSVPPDTENRFVRMDFTNHSAVHYQLSAYSNPSTTSSPNSGITPMNIIGAEPNLDPLSVPAVVEVGFIITSGANAGEFSSQQTGFIIDGHKVLTSAWTLTTTFATMTTNNREVAIKITDSDNSVSYFFAENVTVPRTFFNTFTTTNNWHYQTAPIPADKNYALLNISPTAYSSTKSSIANSSNVDLANTFGKLNLGISQGAINREVGAISRTATQCLIGWGNTFNTSITPTVINHLVDTPLYNSGNGSPILYDNDDNHNTTGDLSVIGLDTGAVESSGFSTLYNTAVRFNVIHLRFFFHTSSMETILN